MLKNKPYFQLVTAGAEANLIIYGDITSWPWQESDVSSFNLSAQLAALQGVAKINVYINSYGGEVGEGLAIYNALKRHPAQVVTYCDGMACSIASVIFMAGDERIMGNPSFLMIHDAWTYVDGNAEQLRKQADDLDVITSASVQAYLAHCNLSEEDLRAKMKADSWIKQDEALALGFATSIADVDDEEAVASQSAKAHAFELLQQALNANAPESTQEPEQEPEHEPENEPNPDETAQKWSGFFNALIGEKD